MHEQAYPNGRIDVAQERPLDVIAKLDASFRLDLLSRTRLLGLLEEVASAETPPANRNAALRACSQIITRLRPRDGVAPPCVVVAPPACPEERETKQALEISVDVHDKRRWQIVSRGNWRMCDFERAFADAKPKGTLADSPLWGRREIFAAPSRFWERISPGQDLAVSSRRTPSSSDLTALLQRVAEHCPGVVAVAAHLPGMSLVSGHERTSALPTLRAAVETHLDAHELVSMIADSGRRLDVELVGIEYHALHRFDPAQWPNATVG